jgi:hypothetical protein
MAGSRADKRVPAEVRAAQAVLIVLGVALLVVDVNALSLVVRRESLTAVIEAQSLKMDSTGLGLLALIALGILLPKVKYIEAGPVKVTLSALDELESEVSKAVGKTAPPPPETHELKEAAESPDATLEIARRDLASKLRALANAARVSDPSGDMTQLADQLGKADALNTDQVKALKTAAATIRQARQASPVSAPVAMQLQHIAAELAAMASARTEELNKADAQSAAEAAARKAQAQTEMSEPAERPPTEGAGTS